MVQVPVLAGQFLTVLHDKRATSAQTLYDVMAKDDKALHNLECLAALDIFEAKWAAYTQHPTSLPFAHPATLVFAGWHAVRQADRSFQHEAHGHAAKKGLPTHDPEPHPPESDNVQTMFAERVNAVLEPVARMLQQTFLTEPPAVEPSPKMPISRR